MFSNPSQNFEVPRVLQSRLEPQLSIFHELSSETETIIHIVSGILNTIDLGGSYLVLKR